MDKRPNRVSNGPGLFLLRKMPSSTVGACVCMCAHRKPTSETRCPNPRVNVHCEQCEVYNDPQSQYILQGKDRASKRQEIPYKYTKQTNPPGLRGTCP